MYIDAYEVFMVPNVYGMLLYGYIDNKNHMMTRPYFCSSNYIIKMSNYKKLNTENESETIDDLYYDLLKTYKDEFSHIYSTAGAIKRLLK
jgi:deoxyribodipyrimidine photolyase-related protein